MKKHLIIALLAAFAGKYFKSTWFIGSSSP